MIGLPATADADYAPNGPLRCGTLCGSRPAPRTRKSFTSSSRARREAARYFAASAPTVHAGRAPAQRFTHPPQRAHCAACGAARAVGRNPPDGWTSGAGTWYCDTHAPAAKMAWSADGDKPSANADANNYTDAGDHNTAYADDANDPFAAQTDYISIFDAPDGREWTDLTYEEAKSLATRARAHLPDTQARNVLPEPTEPDDED